MGQSCANPEQTKLTLLTVLHTAFVLLLLFVFYSFVCAAVIDSNMKLMNSLKTTKK